MVSGPDCTRLSIFITNTIQWIRKGTYVVTTPSPADLIWSNMLVSIKKHLPSLAFYAIECLMTMSMTCQESPSAKLGTDCSICGRLTDDDPCSICTGLTRDQITILVLEDSRDVAKYGRYPRIPRTLSCLAWPYFSDEWHQPRRYQFKSLMTRLMDSEVWGDRGNQWQRMGKTSMYLSRPRLQLLALLSLPSTRTTAVGSRYRVCGRSQHSYSHWKWTEL